MAKKKKLSNREEHTQKVLDAITGISPEEIVDSLKTLLGATQMVSQGRELPMLEVPDYRVRMQAVTIALAHIAGAPAARKPIEPTMDDAEAEITPGSLRPAAKVRMIEHEDYSAAPPEPVPVQPVAVVPAAVSADA